MHQLFVSDFLPFLNFPWCGICSIAHLQRRDEGGSGSYFVPFQHALHLSVAVSVSVYKYICNTDSVSPSSQWVSNVFGYRIYRACSQLKSRQILSSEKMKIYKNLWFRAGHIWAMITVFCCCYWNNFFCFWFKSFQLRFSEPWDLSTYFVRPQGFSPSCYSAQNSQSVFYPVYVLGNIFIYIPMYLVKG